MSAQDGEENQPMLVRIALNFFASMAAISSVMFIISRTMPFMATLAALPEDVGDRVVRARRVVGGLVVSAHKASCLARWGGPVVHRRRQKTSRMRGSMVSVMPTSRRSSA
eukprot:708188-Pleurochrysis_carterae.AAC.1